MIELEMSSDPAPGVGDLYIGSSDGFVLAAGLGSAFRLVCTVQAAVTDATTKIYSRTRPVKILVNDREDRDWSYDEESLTATVRTSGTAKIEVFLR